MDDSNFDIETNPFKIVLRVWNKNIFPKGLIIFWLLLTLLIAALRFLSFKVDYVNIQWLQFSNFIFPGVTGLSVSTALLSATRNLFKIEELAIIYEYTSDEDEDNTKKGDLLYRTLAPYIISTFLWLSISLIAFISSLISIDFPIKINEVLYVSFSSLVVAGLLNLWYLLNTHLEDIFHKVILELEKRGDDKQC